MFRDSNPEVRKIEICPFRVIVVIGAAAADFSVTSRLWEPLPCARQWSKCIISFTVPTISLSQVLSLPVFQMREPRHSKLK